MALKQYVQDTVVCLDRLEDSSSGSCILGYVQALIEVSQCDQLEMVSDQEGQRRLDKLLW